MTSLDVANRCKYFMENYDCVFTYVHNQGETQAIIDPIDKVCRFCGKRYPEVRFKKKAHAISELLGNKEFVLRNECDTCNSFFGQKLEDDFGKYLGLGRTISQIHGKEGVPSYKTRDGKCRIDFTEKGIVIQTTNDSQFIEQHDNYMIFHAVRDAYTPIAVYKALVKMALSLLPYKFMPDFISTVDWLREPSHILSKYNMENYTYIIERYVPGMYPMNLRASGFLRKHSNLMVPNYQFLLEFANYSFQIIIPCLTKDTHLIGHDIDFIPIPSAFETCENPMYNISTHLKNMNCNSKIKDETFELYFEFEKMELHDNNSETIDDVLVKEGISLDKRLKI